MKRFSNTIAFACILMLTTHFSYGQTTAKCNQDIFNDALLDKLKGRWMAAGNVGGDMVVYNFSVQWILNHQFLEINFADTAMKSEYTAKVLIGYDCPKDKYVIHWMDNFGGAFSETLGYGTRKEQSIKMIFDYPQGS